ncbi:(2Fe-2S)-binding protein [Sphingomonas bacterium]|uniref:(2Fe-2S)-binding protein n=1 Tax=Sphingomonas bacterium TaxID=1895847 RepID=UPI001575CD00|nr:(2Fe-2S)-binding protein [Sphingomonas bacterium]
MNAPPAIVSQRALSLEQVRAVVAPLIGHLRVETMPADRDGWVERAAMGNPETGPLAELYGRFTAAGFGANERATAASFMLRHGWAAGFTIGAWLECGVVAQIDDFALKFSPFTLVEALWIRSAHIAVPDDIASGRRAVADALHDFTQDLIARQHDWSRFSRHALWAMVTSSWAAQFAAIGERLGCRAAAVEEGRVILGFDPEIAAASPDVYEVHGVHGSEICQRRAACCLYFKGPRRHFCASCPIIPVEERLTRNLAWADRDRTEGSA